MNTYPDTIDRLRAPKVASTHGGTRRDWANPDEITITDALVDPVGSMEADKRPEVTHKLLVNGLAADIDGGDRVRYTDPRGKTRIYEVLGEPRWLRGPTPLTRHIEADLKAVDI